MKNKKEIALLFEEIYNKTYQEAYGYVLAKTADPAVTPKILEDSYVELYKLVARSSATLKKHRNQLFKIIQKQLDTLYNNLEDSPAEETGRKIKKYESLLLKELETELPAFADKTERSETLQKIMSFVSAKPMEIRRAFYLYYLFNFNIQQIAAELNISEESAGNHIYLLTKEIRTEFSVKQA